MSEQMAIGNFRMPAMIRSVEKSGSESRSGGRGCFSKSGSEWGAEKGWRSQGSVAEGLPAPGAGHFSGR